MIQRNTPQATHGGQMETIKLFHIFHCREITMEDLLGKTNEEDQDDKALQIVIIQNVLDALTSIKRPVTIVGLPYKLRRFSLI